MAYADRIAARYQRVREGLERKHFPDSPPSRQLADHLWEMAEMMCSECCSYNEETECVKKTYARLVLIRTME